MSLCNCNRTTYDVVEVEFKVVKERIELFYYDMITVVSIRKNNVKNTVTIHFKLNINS